MAVISMDASDRANRRAAPSVRIPRQRGAVVLFRVGNTRTDRTPTEFGYRLLGEMRDAGLKAAALARTANVSPSTVTRLIYGGVANPDTDTLGRIAAALVDAQLDPRTAGSERDAAVAAKHIGLLTAAGYRTGVETESTVDDPLVLELQRMIGSGSPLAHEEIVFLRTMVGQLIDPYRSKLHKRSV